MLGEDGRALSIGHGLDTCSDQSWSCDTSNSGESLVDAVTEVWSQSESRWIVKMDRLRRGIASNDYIDQDIRRQR